MTEHLGTNNWLDRDYIKEYARFASDPEASRYEYEVSLPALLALIPENVQRVLDYGCSTGYLTPLLAQKYERVDACDISEYSIKTARNLSQGLDYFVWDGGSPLTEREGLYDVVFAKLVLPFVEDLSCLAANLNLILQPKGCIVASVHHPVAAIVRSPDINYFESQLCSRKLGEQGPHLQSIHRSLYDCFQPFFENGFVLNGLSEPKIPADLHQEWIEKGQNPDLPSRLIMRFGKI